MAPGVLGVASPCIEAVSREHVAGRGYGVAGGFGETDCHALRQRLDVLIVIEHRRFDHPRVGLDPAERLL